MQYSQFCFMVQEQILRVEVFDHRCLFSKAKILWNNLIIKAKVIDRVLVIGTENTLSHDIQFCNDCWLDQIVIVETMRLSYRSSFGMQETIWRSTGYLATRNEKM